CRRHRNRSSREIFAELGREGTEASVPNPRNPWLKEFSTNRPLTPPHTCNNFRLGEYSLVMSMHYTDEDLMVAVREGDVHQLEVLFERYREQLYDFFGRLTADRGISEDLVQDVFVRILKYRASYRETNRFVTWMYQIA